MGGPGGWTARWPTPSLMPGFAPAQAFQDELREAGPGSVQPFARFMLHLSPEDVAALDRRILAILDEYIETDDQRLDQPATAASSCTDSPNDACRAPAPGPILGSLRPNG